MPSEIKAARMSSSSYVRMPSQGSVHSGGSAARSSGRRYRPGDAHGARGGGLLEDVDPLAVAAGDRGDGLVPGAPPGAPVGQGVPERRPPDGEPDVTRHG